MRNRTLLVGHIVALFVSLLLSACGANKDESASLFQAIKNNDIQAVQSLLHNGFNVNVHDAGNQTPLMWAIERSNLEIAKLLIDNGADVNAVGPDEATPLAMTAVKGNAALAHLLIQNGADVEYKLSGIPILLFAAQSGHEEVVKVLLEAGANLKSTDLIGKDALQEAVASGNPRVVVLFLEAGSDPDYKNKRGVSARDLARLSKSAELQELLK